MALRGFNGESLMGNTQSFATFGFLVALGIGPSNATPPQEVPAEVKACKAIANDRERLKCFDQLFGEPVQPQNSPEGQQRPWTIDETKSPDGSLQVVAANLVGDTVLILRCKEQTTEVAFSTQFNYLGYKSVDVQLRINDQNPTKEIWKASINGRAAFAPNAKEFIQSLPDNGKFQIRTTRSDGEMKEGKFNLGAVSEVRSKIAKACDWTNGSVDEPVGSVDHQEKR
jgi:hypothetical protein